MGRERSKLLEISSEHPETNRIRQAVQRLIAGEAIVYPTDTIYGLAVDIEARHGIDQLYKLRKLDPKKPLSLICADLSVVSRYANIHNDCYRFMRRVLPGPYTFVLTATTLVPRTGDKKRRAVGIRIPNNPVAHAIVEELGRPIWTTSALIEDAPADSPSDPWALAEHYGDHVSLVLDAGVLQGTPSSVIDWTGDSPIVLRAGAGDVSELE